MSGRIRTIKPEILENSRTASLPHDAWRLFVSLFLLADDYGNMYGAPERIAGSVFWARPSRDTREALGVLSDAGLIAFYELRGQIYLNIVGWAEHQKIDKPSKPRVPGPQTQGCLVLKDLPRETAATYSRDTRETLAPDLDQDLRSGSPISDQDPRPADSSKSAGVVGQAAFALVNEPSPPRFDFEGVYKAHWIRKEGKADGMAIAQAEIKTQADFEQWTKAVKNYAALMVAEGRELSRQKHFSTFMGCWRDYIDLALPTKQRRGVTEVGDFPEGITRYTDPEATNGR